MGKLSGANIRKTVAYLKRNGLQKTAAAALERLGETADGDYEPLHLTETELAVQRKWSLQYLANTRATGKKPAEFGVLVPCYRTNPEYFRVMVASVLEQSYPNLKLFLADATEDDSLKQVLDAYLESAPEELGPGRVVYRHLESNDGISANTNKALEDAVSAGVNYIALLDHDDLLTPDAFYEMAKAIAEGGDNPPQMLYSDEDKCNEDATEYYEINRKPDYNESYLLSNNYICHLLCVDAEIAGKLRLRSEYDGAQDFDFALRVVEEIRTPPRHIAKVLYHWRCHRGSTAENPESKQYAYDAGLRAMNDALKRRNRFAVGYPLQHLGFYGVAELGDPMEQDEKLGAMGGRVLRGGLKKTVISGALDEEGKPLYAGLHPLHTGYLHRAVLGAEVPALDLRCIRVRREYWDLFEEITGVPYTETPVINKRYYGMEESRQLAEVLRDEPREWERIFDAGTLPKDADIPALSTKLGKALREAGCELRFHPEWETIWLR
jgi:glycosyltransferase involved in cell wall biosynthesis